MDKDIWQESIIQPMKFRKAKDVIPGTASKASSSPAFDDLFLEHWPRIYRLTLHLSGDPAEAEDLALEAFLRLYQQYPAPSEDFNIAGWLYRVATNLALQSIRSFKRREHYELTAGKGALDEASENRPSELFDVQEDHRYAREVLAEMKPQQAEILILRYSGMAYKEIAEAMGLSPTSIGPLLLRAEREFEKRFRALAKEER